jgi:hypothetical protein
MKYGGKSKLPLVTKKYLIKKRCVAESIFMRIMDKNSVILHYIHNESGMKSS